MRHLTPLDTAPLQPTASPQSTAIPSWSGRKISQKQAEQEQLSLRPQGITEDIRELSPRRLVDRCRRGQSSGTELRAIALELERRCKINPQLQGFSSIDLSLLVHSFAKQKMVIPSLFRQMAEAALQRHLKEWKAQDLSMFAWSFATARERHDRLFDAIAREVCRRAEIGELGPEVFPPQNLSNLIWAFATADRLDQPLFHAVAEEVTKRLSAENSRLFDTFEIQHLSNLMWGFAKFGIQHPGFLSAITAELLRRGKLGTFSSFSPQHLSLLPWSFAALGHNVPELMEFVEQEMQRRKQSSEGLRAFQPQTFSNLTWALGKMQIRDESLLNLIAMEVVARSRQGGLHEFRGQNFSNLLWGFATLNLRHDPLFDVVGAELGARHNLSHLTEQDLSTLSWAFASLNLGSSAVFQALIEAALSRGLDTFNTQALMMLVWSVTKSDRLPTKISDRFFHSFYVTLEKRSLSASDQVLFLWCAAVQRRIESSWFQPVISKLDLSSLKTVEIRQLLQIRLETQLNQHDIQWPQSIEELLDQFLTHEKPNEPSHLHREVESCLNKVLEADGRPIAEVEARVSIYRVDLLIRDKKAIFQVQGPTHRPDDAVEAFRCRQLETLGYRVNTIWWHRWNRLDATERAQLVRTLI